MGSSKKGSSGSKKSSSSSKSGKDSGKGSDKKSGSKKGSLEFVDCGTFAQMVDKVVDGDEYKVDTEMSHYEGNQGSFVKMLDSKGKHVALAFNMGDLEQRFQIRFAPDPAKKKFGFSCFLPHTPEAAEQMPEGCVKDTKTCEAMKKLENWVLQQALANPSAFFEEVPEEPSVIKYALRKMTAPKGKTAEEKASRIPLLVISFTEKAKNNVIKLRRVETTEDGKRRPVMEKNPARSDNRFDYSIIEEGDQFFGRCIFSTITIQKGYGPQFKTIDPVILKGKRDGRSLNLEGYDVVMESADEDDDNKHSSSKGKKGSKEKKKSRHHKEEVSESSGSESDSGSGSGSDDSSGSESDSGDESDSSQRKSKGKKQKKVPAVKKVSVFATKDKEKGEKKEDSKASKDSKGEKQAKKKAGSDDEHDAQGSGPDDEAENTKKNSSKAKKEAEESTPKTVKRKREAKSDDDEPADEKPQPKKKVKEEKEHHKNKEENDSEKQKKKGATPAKKESKSTKEIESTPPLTQANPGSGNEEDEEDGGDDGFD